LSKQSLRLDGSPPTVTVAACYSKRKRQDTQVLYPEVASRLREWLKTKKRLASDTVLFPVSAKGTGRCRPSHGEDDAGGFEGSTKEVDRGGQDAGGEGGAGTVRLLKYQNSRGLFADFHSNRHTFITNLERVGVSPRRAQSLARHSDIRLTMGVYTHIGLHDQLAAIELLPAPPEIKKTRNGSANGKVNGSSPTVPDLGAAWAKLSENVKTEIVAMVNAAAKEGSVAT
jgi:integrase